MHDWETELVTLLAQFSMQRNLKPEDIINFNFKLLALHLDQNVDEEDLRVLSAEIYKFLLQSSKILKDIK